jgi:large subunit ribosomal protein L1
MNPIDVAVQLGIDAKKSDQVVRGAVRAAQWHRQEPRVWLCSPKAPRLMKPSAAGADVVGMDDLAAV